MTRKTKLILLCLAGAAPAALAFHIKTASSSEPPGRLVVNGDGSVTDGVTKLIWQQVPTVQAQTAGYDCSTVSIGAHTTGWRLPTVKELVSIVDFESPTSPMIDTAAFPGTPSAAFWTSDGPSSASVFTVSFATGQIAPPGGCCGQINVRCVHAFP